MDTLFLYCLLLGVLLFAGIGFLELISRTTRLPQSVIRKSGHVGLSLILVAVAYLWHKELLVPIGFGFTIIALVLRQLPLKSLSVFKASSYGEVFFPLGVGLAALVAPSDAAFIVSVLILGLADTAAFICGRLITSPRLYGNKTLAGSLAFALVSALILSIGTQSLLVVLIVPPLLAVVELYSKHGGDNLTIPVTSSLLLLLLIG